MAAVYQEMTEAKRILLDVLEQEYIVLEQLRHAVMRPITDDGRDRAMVIWDRQVTILHEAEDLSRELGTRFPIGWGDQWYHARRLDQARKEA